MYHNHLKILIKFPTRGRPEKFFSVLDKYIDNAFDLSKIAFCISMDEDDRSMNNDAITSKLNSYKNKVKLVYFYGKSKSKIQAINADMDKIDGWDIVLLASDDMIPVVKNYDDTIRYDMNVYFKNTDGVLWYNDGGQNKINTLCILGKKYYDRFNYIYNPEYISLWCDNEFTDVSLILGRAYKSEKIIIEHAHPVYQKTNYDELYARNESYFNIDRETYQKRQKNNFDLNNTFPLLSILTVSIPSRIDNSLTRLINKIDLQIKENNLEKKVEHLILIDNKVRTIGRKRDNLIQSAIGKYIAFVDDDDDISDDYVFELTNAIKNNENVDVITFKQKCLIENDPPSIAVFGLKHDNEDYWPGSIFKRKPFHICAWRRELGQKYRVPSNNITEDAGWVSQMWDKATSEHFIDKILHVYIHNKENTSCPQSGDNSVYRNTQI